MVILATPIQTFEDYFRQIGPNLKDGCIVTDVGSTKTLPHQWAQKRLPESVYYVGSHPIAGSEKRGLEELLEKFWSKLGCKVSIMSPQTHDRIFGLVSHLPHIAAAAMVNASRSKDLQFAGRGFIDTTRVASGPANVWADILLTNSKNCAKGIQKLIAQLEELQDAVNRRDAEKVEKLLSSASEKRGKLIQYKIDQQELF
jgi:prephenate dehydrogenase